MWLTELGLGVVDGRGAGAPGEAGTPLARTICTRVRAEWQSTGFFLPGATSEEISWLSLAALAHDHRVDHAPGGDV